MYKATTSFRVRYSETDQMGYVYYGNYASYYEVGRVEALRLLGLTYRQLEASGIIMPVLTCSSVYHKPVKYDELITIEVVIPVMPSTRINFEYRLFSEDDELLHSGETSLAFVDKNTGKPKRIPEQMKILLAPFFDE